MTSRYRLFRRLALAGVVLAFGVVVLGAWVRLSAAGLGCPDWPGCYGHLSVDDAARNVDAINEAFPHRPFEYHKAIKEMVHRYFASSLGLLILALAGAGDSEPPRSATAAGAADRARRTRDLAGPARHVDGDAAAQAADRGAAPARRPRDAVAARVARDGDMPLLPPTLTSPRSGNEECPRLRKVAVAALVVLALQIALGGWTSSNYAALACPDFPTCQNSLWPDMDVKDAFVLWRGLGIDYEGGVLDHPARVAIHFVHRLGAVVAALMLGFASIAAMRLGPTRAVRIAGAAVGAILVCQLILGPVMVIRALPLALATAHNAVAALLLLAVVALNRQLADDAVRPSAHRTAGSEIRDSL